ncbi:MAG TPA: PCMD domain-containing protein [Lentimicrobium sp.]|nr:PCMD domain-containing protein [Lentimicrobium sp.]
MKKTILFFLFIVFLIFSVKSIQAQNQIPNYDFESWTSGEPTNWDTSNENILGTDFVTVTREQNNPYSGTSCAKISTVTQNIFLVGPVTMPGIMTLGDVVIDVLNQTGTVNGGVPITGQPKFLKGFYKYQPAGGDSCYMGLGLTRWNGTSRDTLAYAYKPFGGTVTAWTEFSVPVEYLTWAEPDSMNIMFLSSNLMFGSPVTGSTLRVDSLWLEYSGVAVSDIGFDKNVFVTASNDGNSLIVNIKNNIASKVEVFSLSGLMVSANSGSFSNQFLVNINDLAQGIYIIRITFSNGTAKAVKFSKI